jgi:hypothetical protein
MFCLPNQTNLLNGRAEVFKARKASGFRVHVEQADYRYIISLRPVFISVKFNTSAFHFLAFALAGLLVMGCDSAGTTDEPPENEPSESGSVSFTFVRTANSNVPSDADSAFVRVWQPNGGYNLKDQFNIPDPGQQTEVSLDVPSGSGYRAGVLVTKPAEEFNTSDKNLLAHGSSSQFSVNGGDTTRVNLNVRVADLTLETPSVLRPNQKDTIRAIYGVNPPDVDVLFYANESSNPSFDHSDGTGLDNVGGGQTDTSFVEDYEITGPNVQSEDSTYVKVAVLPDASNEWRVAGRDFNRSYFPSEDGPSFEIPIVPGSGNDDGTVIITFSRDGDGWEKTRRVVE